jgi:Cytochrome P460
MKTPSARALIACGLFLVLTGSIPTLDLAQSASDAPLAFPEHYREWVFLSSGIDMSYRPNAMPGHSMFDNVFVDPQSYAAFLRDGHWPEGTRLVLESRGATQKGSINQTGKFQSTELMGVELHVRDSRRYAGGWGFYVFDGHAPARLLPYEAECYSCHHEHGAVDTTFVQFYPTLLDIAKAKGTLDPAR